MLVDILFFYAQLVFYTSIGFLILGSTKINYLFVPKWIIWALTGITIFLWGSSVFIHFNVPVKFLPLSITSISLFFIMNRKHQIKNIFKSFKVSRPFYSLRNYVFVIAIIGISYLLNPRIKQSAISIRTGPDTIGWLSSAQLLKDENILTNLFSRLKNSLNSSDVLLGFHHEPNSSVPSIYTIPSFQDQVNAEFLIGAHRTGIPGLVGSISYWFGEGSLYHVTNGLILIANFLLIFIGYSYLKSKNVSELNSILLAILLIFNANFFSVFLQGGIGQGVLTPYLLLIILQLTSREKSDFLWKFSLFIFLVASLSTYFDISLFLLLFMTVYSLVGTPNRMVSIIKEYFGKSWVPAVIGILVSFPILSSLPRLLMDRLTSGAYGGWAQGRIPSPTDFLITMAQKRKLEDMKVVISILVIYFIFMINTYASLHLSANNYVLYKASAYSMFSIVILAGIFFAKAKVENESKKILEKSFMPVFTILTLFTSIGAINDWHVFRNQTISLKTKEVMSDKVSKYDFQIVGFKGVDKAKFVMLGDVRYLDSTRGFNLVTKRSTPQRPLLYLVPPHTCKSIDCDIIHSEFRDRSKFKLFIAVPEFIAYVQVIVD